MCTLTVVRERDRLIVTMNRDDVTEREEAPPALWPDAEPIFVAPRDLQAGGSWIGVNRHGVIACLLNRYDDAPTGTTSRGNIVIEAMRGATIKTACGTLTTLDHRAYSPFSCLLIAMSGVVRLDWTGSSLRRQEFSGASDLMTTSSSWRFDDVKAEREALFEEIWSWRRNTADKVATFHTRRIRAHDAWAPMMLRPKSRTKSITQIELTPDGAEMRYWTRETAIINELRTPESSIHIRTSASAAPADANTAHHTGQNSITGCKVTADSYPAYPTT